MPTLRNLNGKGTKIAFIQDPDDLNGKGTKIAFIQDPDGNEIEMIEKVVW